MHRAIFHERRGMQPLDTRWGCLEDYRLRFNIPIGPGERAVANVEPEVGTRTCGVLYLLTPEDCERLDRTEGVHLGIYRRMAVEVAGDDGERVAAFTYRSTLTPSGTKAVRALPRPARRGSPRTGSPVRVRGVPGEPRARLG